MVPGFSRPIASIKLVFQLFYGWPPAVADDDGYGAVGDFMSNFHDYWANELSGARKGEGVGWVGGSVMMMTGSRSVSVGRRVCVLFLLLVLLCATDIKCYKKIQLSSRNIHGNALVEFEIDVISRQPIKRERRHIRPVRRCKIMP